jgi:hypothetical protein
MHLSLRWLCFAPQERRYSRKQRNGPAVPPYQSRIGDTDFHVAINVEQLLSAHDSAAHVQRGTHIGFFQNDRFANLCAAIDFAIPFD